jgi:hypothetical protein
MSISNEEIRNIVLESCDAYFALLQDIVSFPVEALENTIVTMGWASNKTTDQTMVQMLALTLQAAMLVKQVRAQLVALVEQSDQLAAKRKETLGGSIDD